MVCDFVNCMISQSDNIVIDLLFVCVGCVGVEVCLGQSVMFDICELFVFKNLVNCELFIVYCVVGFNCDVCCVVLVQVCSVLFLIVEIFGVGLVVVDVEWFVSIFWLCVLMCDVVVDFVISINFGVVDKNDFICVSYKGGSEFGVFNFIIQVIICVGKMYCVSVIWNDVQVFDEVLFMGLYGGVLLLLC